MKNSRKGFTIVELVIVIAVIAILAAVLIPTFSSLIQKANLSADKQAVREMNLALAADEKLHGKAADVETAAAILARAGYNADNWLCLTKGYEVYWHKQENRLVLYNASTAQIEYPETYDADAMLDATQQFDLYNANHMEAIKQDFTLGVSNSGSSLDSIQSSGSATQQAALGSLKDAIANNDKLQSVIGVNGDSVYVYGTKEIVSNSSNGSFASMQIVAVGDTQTPGAEDLKSDGTVKENVFYISVTTPTGASQADIDAAEAAAGKFVYQVFTQINQGKVENYVSIVVPAGTTIDVSANEWAPVKSFTGYFGTSDADHPIVIDGARLTAATAHSQTVRFTGSQSKYFVTGFFGTVYGNTTIENVTFRNITINEPAMDYQLSNEDVANGKTYSRNNVSIIGGITENANGDSANVTLRNIKVESSVTIKGGATAAGLIGYIGAATGDGKLAGTVTIEGCESAATVVSTYRQVAESDQDSYGACGGLVGLMCRVDDANFTLTVKDSKFTGSVSGYAAVSACIGDKRGKYKVVLEGTNDFTAAGLTQLANSNKYVSGLLHCSVDPRGIVTVSEGATLTLNTTLPAITKDKGTVKNYTVDGTLIVAE